MIEQMNNQNIEINLETIKESVIPYKNISFGDAISEVSSKEANNIIEKDPKYPKHINNPKNAGFFTEELLRSKRGTRDDYFSKILNILHTKKEGSHISYNNLKYTNTDLSHEEKTLIARASVKYEKYLLDSISSKEMKSHIFKKLFSSRTKFYLNYLW